MTIATDTARIAELRGRVPEAFGRPPIARVQTWLAAAAVAVFLGYCLVRFDVEPARFGTGFERFAGIARDMLRPRPGGALSELALALGQSIAIAFLGTLIASAAALPLGVAAARNVMPSWLVRFVLRRHFDFLRGVDVLIWALVYVRAAGLGPLAGVLAIATSDTGTLAKLFAESLEHAERGPADAVRAAGGGRTCALRLGLLPQVLPVMLGNMLYMFESNVRSATILGIVGAGGIGFQLADRIRAHRWDEAAFIILMIVATVALIDSASHALRRRLAAPR